MATLNLGRVRGDKGEDSTVPGPRGMPGPQGPQGPKGEDATNANLGTAATKDVGTGAEQIPQNKNLGTAAFKNAGEAYGNVIEVGAYGLGGVKDARRIADQTPNRHTGTGLSLEFQPAGNGYSYESVLNMFAYEDWTGATAFCRLAVNSAGQLFTQGIVDENTWGAKREVVTKDVTGNVAVSSIQAGAGAPKIAHKKITGTTSSAISSSVTLQTGIAADKIIGMSCLVASEKGLIPPNTYPNGGAELYYCVVNPDGSIKVSLSSGSASYGVVSKPITILLTYEV